MRCENVKRADEEEEGQEMKLCCEAEQIVR